MARAERLALLTLAILGLTAVVYIALLPAFGPARACGAFGVLSLLGIVPFIGLGRKSAQVVFDERDALIQLKSMLAAYTVFWLVVVGSSMGIWCWSHQGTVPANLLPFFPLVGWVTVALVQSVATLVQYAWGK